MTLEQIQTALADICKKYADTRLQHCRLTATTLENSHCLLTGTVLDAETYAYVTAGLTERFPAVTFDVSGVQVLRQPGAPLLTVATNVTSLHSQPNFQGEMLSQLLNGVVLESLLADGSWVYLRQTDGYLGWAYRPYLSDLPAAPPSHLVCRPTSLLYSQPSAEAELASRLVAGTAVTLLEQKGEWVRIVGAGGLTGWLALAELRPLADLPQDAPGQRAQMVQDSKQYIGVPYLWGGGSILGIDCSGYVQLLHHLAGVTIPRDADMQFAAGRPIEPPFLPGDLFFFGTEQSHRSISHVGMSLGGRLMIHSSRAHNGVQIDDIQTENGLRNIYVGARRFLGD